MDLNFVDSEIVVQVLCHVVPDMTAKQLVACWLQTLGFTQEQIAEGMGVSHQMVCKHQAAGLGKIARIAGEWLQRG